MIDLDDAAATFMDLRPRLLGIAYRVLGSRVEAEDAIQDAWVRWQSCDRQAVLAPTAFLVTMVTRIALNTAQSARVRRESSAGCWLPEPVDTSSDPAVSAERNDALHLGMVRLLERLSAPERAAYVLRHAFDYPYSRIADMLQLSECNTRQLVSRAGKHVAAARRRQRVRADDERRLTAAFVAAAQHGEIGALEDVLALSR